MAAGRRSLVVAQAVLFGASASAEQIENYIDTGNLQCRPRDVDPPPEPYNADALKALVDSGRLG